MTKRIPGRIVQLPTQEQAKLDTLLRSRSAGAVGVLIGVNGVTVDRLAYGGSAPLRTVQRVVAALATVGQMPPHAQAELDSLRRWRTCAEVARLIGAEVVDVIRLSQAGWAKTTAAERLVTALHRYHTSSVSATPPTHAQQTPPTAPQHTTE